MFVEISRGRSFKGLAQYCLHDVDRQGDERVAFVETKNLGTDDPQLAWRIMAARHYLQDELKQKACVGQGGAKDGKPVGHLLISWKKEEAEAEQLSQLGMLNAAQGALRAIGANDHQAIIIGHTDTPHPHCHVIINLIGDDGRLKKNWNERKKLSKFALKRELEIHGEAIVKKRQKNWLDRDAGESPEPVKKKPRHLYELDKAAKKCPETKTFATEHHKQVQLLERSKAALRERHKRHQAQLKWCLQERNRRTQTATDQKVRKSRSEVRKAYQQNWHELLQEQEAARREFRNNEASLKGSLANALKLVNWKQVLRREREPQQPGLREAFQILTSEASRREKLQMRQKTEQDQLRGGQRQEEHAQERQLQQEQAALLRDQRQAYLRKAAGMKQRQAASHEALQERQQKLTKERNVALRKFRELELHRKLQQVELRKQQEADRQREHESNSSQPEPELAVPLLSESADGPEPKADRVRRTRRQRPPRSARKQKSATLEPVTRTASNPPEKETAYDVSLPAIAPLPEQVVPDSGAKDNFERRMVERYKTRRQERGNDRRK